MKPLDLDALKALVGEASVSPKAAAELLDETGASASDCETADGRALWAVVEARIRAGEAIDAVALASRTGVAREVALDVVMDGRATLGVARERLALLREASLRRQYLEALRCVAKVVTDRAQPLANAVTEAGKLLASWTDETGVLKPLDEALLPFVDELEEVAAGRRASTLPTGIDTLDAVIGGLQPTLTVIGALPGVGKSALAAAICRNLAASGVTSGLLSLEDERSWLVRRLMAEAASVPVFVLANKPLGRNQQERVLDAAQPLHGLLRRILVDDRPGLTTSEVVASARRMVARGAKAILVDHLGEIRLQRTERHDLDIADALRDLRTLAKSHRVPVVVFTHLRRREGLMATTAEPKLTDFAFSAGIERMARVALGLFRSEDEGELKAAVLKQTQGVSGVTVAMRLNTMAGVVTHSPATTAQRSLYTAAEDDS
jgi:replicative DNA helicase